MMYKSFIFTLSLIASVAAHGYVDKITIAGKDFTGPEPGSGSGQDSVIRRVSTNSPVKGADNPNVKCGPDAKRAKLSAAAMPGDRIDINWPAGGGQNWPHNIGPMMTYLTSCDGPCEEFDSRNARWFKIEQTGKKDNGNWVQEDLMSGKPATITLPSNLKAGNYLLRHEIIALHLATEMGGAEFYPSCAQLSVGGDGTGEPAEDELVSFPGAYKDSDPGIFARNVFDARAEYQFPGPQVASFVNGGNSGNDNNNNDEEPSSSSPSASTPEATEATDNAAATSKDDDCNLKKRAASPSPSPNASAKVKEYRPRHLSRVMRNVVFDLSH